MSFSRSVGGDTLGDLSDGEENEDLHRMSAAKRRLLDNQDQSSGKEYKSNRSEVKSTNVSADKKTGAFGRLGSWFRDAFVAKKQQPVQYYANTDAVCPLKQLISSLPSRKPGRCARKGLTGRKRFSII